MLSREDKENLLASSPVRPIEQESTVCVGKPNAVSPHPTHPSPAGTAERKLPSDSGSRPGNIHAVEPKCRDRSLYGLECAGCSWEMKCENEERDIHEKFMEEMYPNGHEGPLPDRGEN